MENKVVRSPFFYVGDKYKLMTQLRKLFPDNIDTYIEPFAGGGSSFLNTKANKYIVNDIDFYVIELHKCLSSYAGKQDEFLQLLYSIIDEYGLSCSFRGITAPEELKKQYVKTYYSHYNKEAYSKLKDNFNQQHDMVILYLLLIYGFNHMIRFNRAGKFNLPVGNVDFNKNVYNAICHYLTFMEQRDITFYNLDFMEFLNTIEPDKNSYIYLDPPYLISTAPYNENRGDGAGWDEDDEVKLLNWLSDLNSKGYRFALSNVIEHKGKTNTILKEWLEKNNFKVYYLDKDYKNANYQIKDRDTITKEILVVNYTIDR